ncbi:MAG TPA: OmpH family outer membrane protein [Crocinitomicaceae bacterium]|nr:OmpH family outer membrane protein [Crocinitomicaceae bacterium]
MKNLILVAVLLFGTSFASFAQKYGYIDSDYILNNIEEYQTAKSSLDKLVDRWTQEIEDRKEIIRQKKDNFAREEVLLPTEEKEKRQEEIKKLETETMELQKTRFGISGDYFQKRQELIKPIQDRIYEAMQKVASRKNFSFIFDKANQSNLIYADSKFDLSDDVIKELGIKK